jgi:hypothetical protein
MLLRGGRAVGGASAGGLCSAAAGGAWGWAGAAAPAQDEAGMGRRGRGGDHEVEVLVREPRSALAGLEGRGLARHLVLAAPPRQHDVQHRHVSTT